MHIGIKSWLLGYITWAVPCNAGVHIGPFPKIDTDKDSNSTKIGKHKYRLYGESGVGPQCLGFLVSCYVLGGVGMMKRNEEAIIKRFGKFINVKKFWSKAISLGIDERNWMLDHRITTFNQLLKDKPWDT